MSILSQDFSLQYILADGALTGWLVERVIRGRHTIGRIFLLSHVASLCSVSLTLEYRLMFDGEHVDGLV
jgi:hypothetical protein